jgi:N-acetylglucosaminyl-diphospho-decaprenol L-rhamnosyltransferase
MGFNKVARCGAVVVTHNSALFLSRLLSGLLNQTVPFHRICIIDSGSEDPGYLKCVPSNITVKHCGNVGFSKGNNIGISHLISSEDVIAFVNPDCFLHPLALQTAIDVLNSPGNQSVGAIGGMLLGFDISRGLATGRVDSTGIVRSCFGRWIERDQGKPCSMIENRGAGEIDFICGALMICRSAALRRVQLSNEEYFDESFFMYKEDVDLCLRMRRSGWRVRYEPAVSAFHCRGWKSRSLMARRWKLMSARNDVRLYWRDKSPFVLFSLLKYLYVFAVEIGSASAARNQKGSTPIR